MAKGKTITDKQRMSWLEHHFFDLQHYMEKICVDQAWTGKTDDLTYRQRIDLLMQQGRKSKEK